MEDNADDVFLMQRGLQKARITFPLQIVTDGKMAVDYLSGSGIYQNRQNHPLPELVFLDLKLPFLHGFQVLEWIRTEPGLSLIQVVILSSSLEDKDQERARQLGAPYLVKPPSPETLLDVITSFGLA